MTQIKVKNIGEAVTEFNRELNYYYSRKVSDDGDNIYFGDGAMLCYLGELEEAMNEGTDLAWELGYIEETGRPASFEPSESWAKKYLSFE